MAAAKPIISTKITDVVRDYSSCVSFVENATEFCNAIAELLRTKDGLSMQMEYYEILKKTSWDATAATMKTLVKNFAK